ncbi:hypothetical protein T05_2170 [Trichinella murrelli]|uniref:Uncharacterized protein n=1 Tax=Trichinella murrelli TaxID=144512 RepID=A0A0V0THW9_9BILA|nr:hypothetical protein T05_2170 [Trichinella murrelli]
MKMNSFIKNPNNTYCICNVPPGAAAGSASTSAPVRPPLLLFADSSSLPRSLLRVAIIRARIVTATALRARPLDPPPWSPLLPYIEVFRRRGAPGWVN